jgi:hypothetical protein
VGPVMRSTEAAQEKVELYWSWLRSAGNGRNVSPEPYRSDDRGRSGTEPQRSSSTLAERWRGSHLSGGNGRERRASTKFMLPTEHANRPPTAASQ